jgi:hypothetical protein
MEVAGGYQVGRTYLVDRSALAAYLSGLVSGESVNRARRRKERILASLREPRVAVTVTAAAGATASGLAGVERRGVGRVEIVYSDATDLLGKLVQIATAAEEDFSRFREMFE